MVNSDKTILIFNKYLLNICLLPYIYWLLSN